MAEPLLCARLGDIDALFHAWCHAQGVSPADALRTLVAQVVASGTPAESTIPNNKRIRIHAGAAHEPFLAWCQRHKTTTSAALRRLALQTLLRSQVAQMEVLGLKPEGTAEQMPVAQAFTRAADGALATESQGDTDADRVRLEIRLSASEQAALSAVATASGVSAQKLAVRLIRASLLGNGVLTGDESKHLGDINLSLLRIGGNLNQIAKHLNAQPGAAALLMHEELHKCVVDIEGYVKQAAQVLQSGRERWRMTLKGGSHG